MSKIMKKINLLFKSFYYSPNFHKTEKKKQFATTRGSSLKITEIRMEYIVRKFKSSFYYVSQYEIMDR